MHAARWTRLAAALSLTLAAGRAALAQATGNSTEFLADNRVQSTNRITDISMDGCTLQTTGLPRGTFLGLVLKPDQEDESIRIETAMVCSVHPPSVGLRFLEIPLPDQRRLSQVVLGLLVSQGHHPTNSA